MHVLVAATPRSVANGHRDEPAADRASVCPALSAVGEALRQNASLTAFTWGVFTAGFFYAVVVMVYTALRFRTMYPAERLSAAELATERRAGGRAHAVQARHAARRSCARTFSSTP